MNIKTRIYIDFDGVLANSDEAMADYYNRYFKHEEGFIPANGKLITTWNARNQMPLITGREIGELFNSDYFWEKLTIKKDAIKYMENFCSDERFEVCILSVGQNVNKSKKALFIEEYFPFCKEVILITGNIFDKNEITDNCIILDDHEKNLKNPLAYNVLMKDRGDREFNQNCHPNTVAVSSWEMFYNACVKIYEEGLI